MQRYTDYVTDQRGEPVAGASILVNLTGTSTAATLYVDNSLTPLTNPVVSDSLGKFYFYAADDRYDLVITGSNFPTQTVYDVMLEDVADPNVVKASALTVTGLSGIMRANTTTAVGLATSADLDQILPTQTGHTGEILSTNGTTASWSSAGAGSVLSVDVSGGTTGLTTSGGPITGSGTITIAGTLAETNGGTGQTIYAPGQVLVGNAAGGLTKATVGSGTNITVTSGDGSVSVGLSGTVAVGNGGTGATTLTGLVKGNGASAFTAASAGTDYVAATSGSAVQKADGAGGLTAATAGTDYSEGTAALATGIVKSTTTTGALSIAVAGTDYVAATSGSAIQKADGAGGLTAATADVDYATPAFAMAMAIALG